MVVNKFSVSLIGGCIILLGFFASQISAKEGLVSARAKRVERGERVERDEGDERVKEVERDEGGEGVKEVERVERGKREKGKGLELEKKEKSVESLQQYFKYPDQDVVIIEKIGVEVPIVWPTSLRETDLQEAMRHGVAHFPATVKPYEKGNMMVSGHSTYYESDPGEFKEIFKRLGELKKGDEIRIEMRSGKHKGGSYFYEVMTKEEVSPTDQRIFDVFNKNQNTLTLTTCWPIGSYEKRLMVKADLIKKSDKNR